MRRAIVLVLDGCGAGVAPDAPEFGDHHQPNTLKHVCEAAPVDAPTLAATGFFAAAGVALPSETLEGFDVAYGRLQPLSKGGKDSVTGHWEMMGIVPTEPFPTYPQGFPAELIEAFEEATGRGTIGNRPASGTQIIAELGAEMAATGKLIVYTSADSVFQIAAHEDVVPIEELYECCRIARALCQPPNHVQRVIARPFIGDAANGFTRTERRKDYPLSPPENLVDRCAPVYGIGVVPELFGGRGFMPVPRTQSNPEHARALVNALESDCAFIFANFEDFDMLYGHRSDPVGFARCLNEFDPILSGLLAQLKDDDLLILTADHGNDPTDPSTDHTREYVPYVVIQRGTGKRIGLGDEKGFAKVGDAVAEWLQASKT